MCFSFGKEEKCIPYSKEQLKIPGPEKYSPKRISDKQTPVYTIPKSTQKDRTTLQDKRLGPGTYTLPYNPGLSKSFALKLQQKDSREANPGPGSYNEQSYKQTIKQCPKYSCGKKTMANKFKQFEEQQLPGPNHYQSVQQQQSQRNIIGTKFDKDQRQKDIVQANPGPGAYHPRIQSADPKYSLGRRRNSKKVDETPGPGTYNPGEF